MFLIDSLEINEVYKMFMENGININEATLRKLFCIIDKTNKGALDLDGFKKFTMSEEANESNISNIIKMANRFSKNNSIDKNKGGR
jgi:hypothetical protein